jgi:hypothetical protein
VHSRWLGFTMLVPFVNLAMLIWFALSEWPIETALTRLRHGQPELPPYAVFTSKVYH